MKVAIITFLANPVIGGGAARSAKILARTLADRGIQVVVITTDDNETLSVREERGIRYYRFRPKNHYWVGVKDQQKLYKKIGWQIRDTWNRHSYEVVSNILRKESPDIVHVHKLRGLSPSVWRAAIDSKVPRLVHTCRDYELLSPEGTLSGVLGRLAKRRISPLWPYQAIRRKASSNVHVATAPSRYTLNLHIEQGFFAEAVKAVVPNSHGFSDAQLERMRRRLQATSRRDTNTLRLLYLGRIEPTKGVAKLCDLVSRLSLHGVSVTLDVVGSGTYESTIRSEFEFCPNIYFHGGVFGSEKSALITASDVLVVPSTWPEVFGLVIAEAYAHGKPVIGARIGGIPELVTEGRTGFLFAPHDSRALKRVILDLTKSPDILSKMSPYCFKSATKYTTDAVTNGYLSLYTARD